MTRWRPQGVTTFSAKPGDDDGARRLFALVSWYGRADEGYSDRGGRVSSVDVSRMMRRRRRRRRRRRDDGPDRTLPVRARDAGGRPILHPAEHTCRRDRAGEQHAVRRGLAKGASHDTQIRPGRRTVRGPTRRRCVPRTSKCPLNVRIVVQESDHALGHVVRRRSGSTPCPGNVSTGQRIGSCG